MGFPVDAFDGMNLDGLRSLAHPSGVISGGRGGGARALTRRTKTSSNRSRARTAGPGFTVGCSSQPGGISGPGRDMCPAVDKSGTPRLLGSCDCPRQAGARPRPQPSASGWSHPAFGVYLLGQPPSDVPWESRWLRWPDFRLPADRADVLPTLTEAWQRAATERVEIACASGRGRTGTALACLANLGGVPASRAVGFVREHYNQHAVETLRQRRYVARWRGRESR